MLDKLTLNYTSNFNKDWLLSQLKPHYDFKSECGSTYNHEAIHLKRGGYSLLSLFINPKFGSKPPVKIMLNPSNLKSFEELLEILPLPFKDEGHSIGRIDHAVDIPISINEIIKTLYIPRKKV